MRKKVVWQDKETYTPKVCLNFGGGTNSSAIIAGIIEKELERPALILFADTGGEKPHTYHHIEWMQQFLNKHGFPEITIVKKVKRDGSVYTLEQNCIEKQMLPSIAYGRKGCSHKYKIAPSDKFRNKFFKEEFKNGRKIDVLIGYDFAETRRWMKMKIEDEKYFYSVPLVEWEWNRNDCVSALQRVGIPQPGKSACFFCPSSKKHEIIQLGKDYPDLLERALSMEELALSSGKLKSVKGLARNKSWKDILAGAEIDQTLAASQCDWCVDFET